MDCIFLSFQGLRTEFMFEKYDQHSRKKVSIHADDWNDENSYVYQGM